MAAAAASLHPAQPAPILVVVSNQAGQRLARSAISEDCRGDLAAAPALLHPGFRRRVLSRFRPVAFRVSKLDSTPGYAQRGHVHAHPPFALGRYHPSASWIADTTASGLRL